jgi:hypothetical protein
VVVLQKEHLILLELLKNLVKEMEEVQNTPPLLAMELVKSIEDKVRDKHGLLKP